MLEYVAYALLGLVGIGALLYGTMSAEAEDEVSSTHKASKPTDRD